MKIIKIITLHCPLNYGAALQAYALKTYLNLIGNKADMIDYRPDYIMDKQKYSYAGRWNKSRNLLLKLIYALVKLSSRYKMKNNFARFQNNELCDKTSTKYHTCDELAANPPKAQVYFCGSDQIWNTHMENGWDDSFFLDFVKEGRKCSYAASMAISQPLNVKETNRFTDKLNGFDFISVREEDAKRILQPFTDKQIEWVLDPVFLLPAKKWAELANKEKQCVQKDYILIYPMGDGANILDVAKNLSKQTGLPIYSISKSMKEGHVDQVFNSYSPYQFLHLFKNASYVVTNSFHGTSFSIIFRKNFWSCSVGKTSSRIISLLESLMIGDRYIQNDIPADLTKKIEYSVPSELLDKRLTFSKDYINKCLQ